MSLGGLSGLASGVDTTGIVDQLINLERQANARLGLRKVAVQARQTGLKDIATKLAALKSAAQELSSATTWTTKQGVESSDAARVTATLLGGAGTGGTTIHVDRLASSARRGFEWTANGTAGTLKLSYDDDPTNVVTIDVKADATAADVAASINAKGGAPAFASVIKDPLSGEERLVLSARRTGDDSVFTVDASGLQAGQLDEDATYERSVDLDAAYRVNGSATTFYSETNTVDNAVPGVRLVFKGVTAAPASVTVSEPALDADAVKAKAKAFVDAYNAVVTATRSKLTEKAVPTASTSADAAKGQLFGDTGLLSMLSSLRTRMADRVDGLTGIDDLGDIGIAVPKATGTATQDARDGKLAFDEKAFTTALANDSAKVRDLFNGFATSLDAFIKKQTGATGVLESRQKAADGEIARIDDRVTRAEDRLAAKEKRLKAQFAAMESALLNAQSQGAWLAGQLGTLSG